MKLGFEEVANSLCQRLAKRAGLDGAMGSRMGVLSELRRSKNKFLSE